MHRCNNYIRLLPLCFYIISDLHAYVIITNYYVYTLIYAATVQYSMQQC